MRQFNMITADDFGNSGAAFLIDSIKNSGKDIPSVALPTGKTPQPIYKALRETGMPAFHFINLDQYWGISHDDPRSYIREIAENLLDPLNIPDELRLTFNAMAEDSDAECKRMDYAIQNLADSRIDIAVLGIGPNGHIGFNEPGTGFESRTHLVSLAEKTHAANASYCDPYGGVPEQAITLGLQTIFEARQVILLARMGKEDILDQALNGPVTENVPASLLQKHDNLHVLVDPHVANYFGLS